MSPPEEDPIAKYSPKARRLLAFGADTQLSPAMCWAITITLAKKQYFSGKEMGTLLIQHAYTRCCPHT